MSVPTATVGYDHLHKSLSLYVIMTLDNLKTVGRVEEANITVGDTGEVRFVIIGNSGSVSGIIPENIAREMELELPDFEEQSHK